MTKISYFIWHLDIFFYRTNSFRFTGNVKKLQYIQEFLFIRNVSFCSSPCGNFFSNKIFLYWRNFLLVIVVNINTVEKFINRLDVSFTGDWKLIPTPHDSVDLAQAYTFLLSRKAFQNTTLTCNFLQSLLLSLCYKRESCCAFENCILDTKKISNVITFKLH